MKIQFNSLTNLINKCWSCLSPFKVLSGKTNSSRRCIFLQSPVNEHLSYFWHLQSNLESSMHSTAAIYFLQRLIVPVLLKDECRSPFQTSCSGLLSVRERTSKPIMLPSSRPSTFIHKRERGLAGRFASLFSTTQPSNNRGIHSWRWIANSSAATRKATFHSVTLET